MKVYQFSRILLVTGTILAARVQGGAGILKADTYVSSANAAANFGSVPLINIGSGNSGLLQFDFAPSVSKMLTGLSQGSKTAFIGNATLTVYVNKVAAAGTLSAAALLGTWSESAVTFGTLPSQAAAVANITVTTAGQLIELDVTDLVRGWLANDNNPADSTYVGGGNFGVYLSSPDGGVFALDSKEATTTSHAATLDIDLATDFTGVLVKDMTLTAPGFTSLMSIHLTGTNTAGGRIFYMIRATDGGSQIATEEGVIQFLAEANEVTCTVQTADKKNLGTVNSGCTPGFFNPGSQPGVSIFDNVSFESPAAIAVHEVYYRIQNLSGAVVRLEP